MRRQISGIQDSGTISLIMFISKLVDFLHAMAHKLFPRLIVLDPIKDTG